MNRINAVSRSIIQSVGYLLIVCCFWTLLSCNTDTSSESEIVKEEHEEEETTGVEVTGTQLKNAGIELSTVQTKQISGTIRVNGVLDVPPQQLVSISAPLGGFLKNTTLLQGTRVKKGQIVATIENLDFIQMQQDYLEAKSEFELARADYERQQQLATENVNSNKVLQQSKAKFTTWQAKYNGLAQKLKVLNINAASVNEGDMTSTINLYSPINGYVTEVNVNIGKFVSPTDVLFEIVDTEHLHAELIIFEKDVRKLRIGQKVRFTLANETKERMATVYLIGREIGNDRTIQIHCHIDEEDKEMLPGMYLKAAVETGGAEVPALPDGAIIDFQGKKYIFVVATDEGHVSEPKEDSLKVPGRNLDSDETHFTMYEVQLGNSELGFTEVMLPEDFDLQSKIAVKGAYALLSKMKNSEDEEGHH